METRCRGDYSPASMQTSAVVQEMQSCRLPHVIGLTACRLVVTQLTHICAQALIPKTIW